MREASPSNPVRAGARWGALAVAGMAAFYAVVVAGASGSLDHLADQIRADWYLLAPIITGFGVQVGLVVELRRRRRLTHGPAVTGPAGAGGSTVGMIACCAHHLAELAPFVALTGAATFLVTYRAAFMAVGLATSALGIGIATRRLRHLTTAPVQEAHACVAH